MGIKDNYPGVYIRNRGVPVSTFGKKTFIFCSNLKNETNICTISSLLAYSFKQYLVFKPLRFQLVFGQSCWSTASRTQSVMSPVQPNDSFFLFLLV